MATDRRLHELAGIALLAIGSWMGFGRWIGVAEADRPACSGAPGSVEGGYGKTVSNAKCTEAVDCQQHSTQCNETTCAYCDGAPGYYSFCQTGFGYMESCEEGETGCGMCYVEALCVNGTCSGGHKRDADEDGDDDACYIRSCT